MSAKRFRSLIYALAITAACAGIVSCGLLPEPDDQLTVEVRNESGGPVALEVVDTTSGPGGKVHGPPIQLETDEVRDVTFTAPTTRWGVRLRGDEQRHHDAGDLREYIRQLQEGAIPEFYLLVRPDGTLVAVSGNRP